MPLQDRPPPPEPQRERTQGWGALGFIFLGIGLVLYFAAGGMVVLAGATAEADNFDALPLRVILMGAASMISFVVGVGVLIAKVLVDRVLNREDHYYSKHIKR